MAPPVGATSPHDKKTARTSANGLADFDQFWELYPARNGRKREKRQARIQWGRLSRADRDCALQAVRHYAAEEKFVKDPFRWLRDKSFEDWIDSAQQVGRLATQEDLENAGYTFVDGTEDCE